MLQRAGTLGGDESDRLAKIFGRAATHRGHGHSQPLLGEETHRGASRSDSRDKETARKSSSTLNRSFSSALMKKSCSSRSSLSTSAKTDGMSRPVVRTSPR